ncbi:cob(I)yrinic acid a,c-diamide adenosyltransferase [Chloroflexota bacterium]
MTEKESFDSSTELPVQGMVQIFTGEGKGKTTAAMGEVVRAVGHGRSVYIVFFMKGGDPSGEQSVLSKLPNVTIACFGTPGFVNPDNITAEDRKQAKLALATASEAVLSSKYDLVVLDEINLAASWELIKLEEVILLIMNKPEKVELILTGRHADSKLSQRADLVTEMLKIKHPYDEGTIARPGVEY